MKDPLRRSHPSGATKAAAAKRLGKCDNQRAFKAQSSTGLVSNGKEEAGTGVKGRGLLFWLAN